jgi:hypothetical protein
MLLASAASMMPGMSGCIRPCAGAAPAVAVAGLIVFIAVGMLLAGGLAMPAWRRVIAPALALAIGPAVLRWSWARWGSWPPRAGQARPGGTAMRSPPFPARPPGCAAHGGPGAGTGSGRATRAKPVVARPAETASPVTIAGHAR